MNVLFGRLSPCPAIVTRANRMVMMFFLFVIISFYLLFRAAKLRKREGKALGKGRKVDAEGENLNKCSEFLAILFIRAGGCDVYRLVGRLRCAGS